MFDVYLDLTDSTRLVLPQRSDFIKCILRHNVYCVRACVRVITFLEKAGQSQRLLT